MVDVTDTEVRLRPLTLADVDALIAAREADASSFPWPHGGEARARLRKQIERNPTLAEGGFLELAVEREGQLIGDVQARAPERGMPPGVCEIGILIFPGLQGRGHGRQAVAIFTEYLFREGLARVQASTALDNVAMRRVLERVGYTFEGVLRDFMPTRGGGREDYAMYAITRGDWDALTDS